LERKEFHESKKMKILAIEKEIEGISWENQEQTLKEEAHQVFRLYLSDCLREIYFTHENFAVLVLECENLDEAAKLLGSLPLVQRNVIAFNIMQLKPYNGYERIIG
jgi:hypothetical protein